MTRAEHMLLEQTADLAFTLCATVGIAIGNQEDFDALFLPGWYSEGRREIRVDPRGRGAIQRTDGVHGLGFRPLLVIVLPSAMEEPQNWWQARVIDLRVASNPHDDRPREI